jgi:hypothetical protein
MYKNILAMLDSCGQSGPILPRLRLLRQKTGALVHYRYALHELAEEIPVDQC